LHFILCDEIKKGLNELHFDNYDSLNNIKISIIHFGIIESYMVSLMKKIRVYFFHWK